MPRVATLGGETDVTTIPAIDVLLVCTGNICRSPMAAGLLRQRLAALGVSATVRSTGLAAAGRPATPEAVEVIARDGIDISDHRSRVLRAVQIEGVDLVLGMERHHVREAVLADPACFERAFTLKELVRRGERAGHRQQGETVAAWLARVGAGRRLDGLVGAAAADDVPDPSGRSVEAYERCAGMLAELVDRLVELLFPASQEQTA